ncbi:protein of unknown function [Caballeronia sp. S22]
MISTTWQSVQFGATLITAVARGRMMRFSARKLLAVTGIMLTSAVSLFFPNLTCAAPSSSRTAALQNTSRAQIPAKNIPSGQSDMSSNIKMASAEQQRKIFEWLKFGLDWASGRAGSEELIRTFGRPKLDNVLRKVRSLDYFPDFASISLESNIDDGSAKAFTLTVSSELDTSIPKESYENLLGLHRVVRGELIDGQRTEESDFFNPNIVPNGNPDVVTLIYRVPLPSESAFDVYVDIDYLGKNEFDGPEFDSLKRTTNLRKITIHRFPLLLEELEQRNRAKQK